MPLPMHQRGHRRDFDLRLEARVGAADAHPVEVRCGLGAGHGEARDQFGQPAVRIGLDLKHLAAAAVQQPARERVGAQEVGRRRIADVEPREQAVGRVAAACEVCAVELQLMFGQRVELRLYVLWVDVFGHQPLRPARRVRCHRGDAECRDPEPGQPQYHGGRGAARMGCDEPAGLRCDEGQRLIP